MMAKSPFLDVLERLLLVRDGYYHADLHTSRRAAMILAMDRGISAREVARSARCSRSTVHFWLRRYRQHRDVAALIDGHSPPRDFGRLRAAQALNAMKPPASARPGRLSWGDRERSAAGIAAATAPDPSDRLDAATLRAIDRGVPVSHAARAAGRSRMTIYRLMKSRGVTTRPRPSDG